MVNQGTQGTQGGQSQVPAPQAQTPVSQPTAPQAQPQGTTEVVQAIPVNDPPKRRGRPAGSKNKPSKAKKVGRPKGKTQDLDASTSALNAMIAKEVDRQVSERLKNAWAAFEKELGV